MKYILSISFLLVAFSCFAQETLKRTEYDLTPLKGIVYFKEQSLEFELQSNGLNIGFNRGTISKYNLTKFYHFDIGYLADMRERSKTEYLSGFEGISNYTYGKQNYFFVLRGGLGRKYYLSEKARKRGIALGYSFEGGANLGILKPYMLILEYNDDLERTFRTESYSEENAELFLDVNKIRDKGGFFKGWDETSIVPGFHANFALHFSLGAYEKYIKALEVGIHLDAFIKDIPIMIETEANPNRFLFAHFFINFQLGKRSR